MAAKSDTTNAVEREAAIVAAYKAGKKIAVIQAEFEVGRTTLYHILRRSGVMPSRSRKNLEAASRDAALAGLHELISHQDRLLADQAERIAVLEDENRRLAAAANGAAAGVRRQTRKSS